ncbi:MAG TPA: MiaB/RimO family radical SAM methylthiotransferase [Gemmatimonadaceae bacterium]|nr:MiaB/RimO family radical SAM methylthiotransferase [Gemmatimonadaceae bacterium]
MKVYLATWGCRANQYDTEAVRAMLDAAGHEVVASPEEAEAGVFNGCAVTAQAEADLRQGVRRAARRNPALRATVMGCAAARDDGTIAALPGVEAVVPGADLVRLARALDIDPALAAARASRQTGARALLRIQDGCDEHCTFCATTLARGANRSRPVDVLVDEARRLADHHAEIVITGVHIGTYGADAGGSLSALVTRLVRDVPAVRFRLSSVEATEVDEPLRELLVSPDSGLVPWLHAPLQSGSDRVLRRMGRHWYDAASYASAVERIARDAPVLGLGADIIAGFPGETDEDHRATLALVEALPFTALHVFPFSPRPGTAATRLPGHVREADVGRRSAELRAAGARKSEAHRAARDGGIADVVVVSGPPERNGLTEDNLTVVPTDGAPPRGTRFRARLRVEGRRLFASPLAW